MAIGIDLDRVQHARLVAGEGIEFGDLIHHIAEQLSDGQRTRLISAFDAFNRLREMLELYKAKHRQPEARFGLDEQPDILEGARALIFEDPATFLEIIDGGPLGPPYAKMKGTMMIERSYEPSFSLALAAKDARLALEAAEAQGLDLPALRAICAQLEKAVELGHGDEDMAAAVEAVRAG